MTHLMVEKVTIGFLVKQVDDQITAGDGDDYIEGGDGKDVISAGDGNNHIEAQGDNDTITTGVGNDEIMVEMVMTLLIPAEVKTGFLVEMESIQSMPEVGMTTLRGD